MERKCELCGKDISDKKSNARYCSRQHKNKHYRHINRDKVRKWKRDWSQKNISKRLETSRAKCAEEREELGYSKKYLREYAKRHMEDLRKIKRYQCFKCGKKEYLSIHHTKYTKDPKDWEFVCEICHIKVHSPESLL